MKIALISCSKSKQCYPCMAAEMYQPSILFEYSYKYAKRFADKVYILSSKYGLIPEHTFIEPYDETLKNMSLSERIAWSNKIISQLEFEFDLENDEFMILAGRDYNEYLLKAIKNYELTLGNRQYGMRVEFLKNALQENQNDCFALHELFNSVKRLKYDEIDKIPFNNGIYVVFEKGEKYRNLERIVRVGTHDSPDRLKLRLRNHFFDENKDGSIFRKNIGKSILNKRHDNYLNVWSLDTSKPENYKYVNRQKQISIEKEVTDYLRNNFTFTCFEVIDQVLRLRLEKAIIATLNLQHDFYPSNDWLGRFSPVARIQESGLWLVMGLDDKKVTPDEMRYIKGSTSDYRTNDIETKVATSKNETKPINKVPSRTYNTASTGEIKQYIVQLLKEAKESGAKQIILVSGEIQRMMGVQNCMPSVCSAMYQAMNSKDEILNTTPSGKSSTIKIKYYL